MAQRAKRRTWSGQVRPRLIGRESQYNESRPLPSTNRSWVTLEVTTHGFLSQGCGWNDFVKHDGTPYEGISSFFLNRCEVLSPDFMNDLKLDSQ